LIPIRRKRRVLAGAQGGGTALDLCVDEYNGTEYTGTSCSDTLNGKIQVP
jgi:hypothetical protein